MPLRVGWEPLERDVLKRVPARYGVYELGDDDGDVLVVDHGPLRDAVKEALAYHGEATRVRYRVTAHREEAEALAAEHRARLEAQ